MNTVMYSLLEWTRQPDFVQAIDAQDSRMLDHLGAATDGDHM